MCGPLLASLFVLMPMSLKMMCVVFPAGESVRFNADEFEDDVCCVPCWRVWSF